MLNLMNSFANFSIILIIRFVNATVQNAKENIIVSNANNK